MAEIKTLIKANPLLPAEDFVSMRKQGFKDIEKYGSAIWTEYNNSDPGITILDAVCYAITDLGYRTGFEIKDILAPENLTPDTWKQIFYTARQILHNSPLTITDYRKLIIDVKGVRNAWIEPSKDYEVPVWVNYDLFELNQTEDCDCEPSKSKGCYGKLVIDPLDIKKLKERAINRLINQIESNKKKIEELDAEYNRLEQLIQQEEADGEEIQTRKWREEQRLLLNEKGTLILQLRILNKELPRLKNSTGLNSKIVEFEGLYNVMVEYEENVLENKEREEIRHSVLDRLMSHRNLGEDFLSVNAVEYEDFGIAGSIVLEEYADPDLVYAQILFTIYKYFSPSVPFYTIPQMVGKGYSIDEIFEGPALKHGFIDTTEIEKTDLFRDIRLSDIINEVADIKGIKAVTYLRIPFNGFEDSGDNYFDTWINFLREQRKIARLVTLKSTMLFCKERDFITYNVGTATDRPQQRMLKLFNDMKVMERKYKLEGVERDLPVPTGENMEIEDYFPVTYSLPMCYGVSERAGLPADATETQKAQALQLEGYLLFFEQLLSDYLVQLNHIRDLFTFDGSVDRTYFTRALTEIGDLQKLVIDHQNRGEGHWSEILEDFTHVLENLVETPKIFANRRNQFLDHMLARFSEDLTEYEKISKWLTPYKVEERLIADKIRILANGEYYKISSNRGKGFNYTLPDFWDTGNVSGTERRVSRLLGFKYADRRTLAPEIIWIEAAMEADSKKKTPDQKVNKERQPLYVIKIVDPETKDPLLTSVEVTEGCCIDLLIREILKYADERKYFNFEDELRHRSRKTADKVGKFSFDLFDNAHFDEGVLLAQGAKYATRKERETAFKRLQYLLDMINDNEGFHLVEHILLRPKFDEVLDETNDEMPVKLLDICLDQCDLGKGMGEGTEIIYYKKRISRIPANRCYDKMPWVLEYYRLNPTVDADGNITDYRYDQSILFQETFPDESDPVVLKFRRYEQLTQRAKDIQEYGSERINYEIVSDQEEGNATIKYAFIIHGDNDEVLAMSPYIFNRRKKNETGNVEDDIEVEIARLIRYLGFELDLYCDKNPCDNNEDPYSFRATAVFPCWTKRFKDPTFRALVEKTIQSQAPAHVYINVKWIGIQEMAYFEKVYCQWLKEMAQTEMPAYEFVNPLVEALNTMKECSDCEEECY